MINVVKLQEGHPVDENLRPIKVGGKATAIETAQHGDGARVTGDLEVTGDIRGNIKDMVLEDVTLDSLTTNSIISTNLAIDDSGDITLDADGGNIYFKDDGNTYIQWKVNGSVDTMVVTGDFIIDTTTAIQLDSGTGAFIAKKAGTEFSVANSAYAGMIIGYTTDGINQTPATYTLGTGAALVASGTHHVSFIAPPSGVVEIEVQINYDAGSSGQQLSLGLSDHTSIFSNSLASYLLQQIYEAARAVNDMNVIHKWVVTGLTAGDTYKWYLTARVNSTVGTPKLQWGGDSTIENPLFIMKATALPTAVTDFAVYG